MNLTWRWPGNKKQNAWSDPEHENPSEGWYNRQHWENTKAWTANEATGNGSSGYKYHWNSTENEISDFNVTRPEYYPEGCSVWNEKLYFANGVAFPENWFTIA